MTAAILFKFSLLVLIRTIPTVIPFTSLPVPAITKASHFSSPTAVYYLEKASVVDTVATEPQVAAAFKTSASENADWQAAIDELIQGISGNQKATFFSASSPEEKAHYDRQEAFNRALLQARLAMERRQRCDQQEVNFRSLLEARLKMEQRQRLYKSSQSSPTMVFLFVGQYHAESFEEIASYAQSKLQHATEVVAVLGGGVIGGGSELDQTNTPAMSMLAGSLPVASSATFFQFEEGVDKAISDTLPLPQEELPEARPPSYMVFSDPFAPLSDLLTQLDQQQHTNCNSPPVVAGGVSVPPRQRRVPSIARNGQVLPAGSLVGVQLAGNIGLQVVVAQGCRPVGPTYVITEAKFGNILTKLSGQSAISRLEEVAAGADEKDQELIRNGELVCGLGSSDGSVVVEVIMGKDNVGGEEDELEGMMRIEDDFLIRQIMGFRPVSGSMVVAAGGLKEGMTFRFHVRAAKSAREDMDLMIQRSKTERLFAGSSSLLKNGPDGPSATAGKPLAAFQFSCVARGSSFFGVPNVDLKKVEELFDEDGESGSPIAGFFANGEIGPVGIRTSEMAAKDAEHSDKPTSSTFLHGFTTVVAMLCDYSEASISEATEELSASSIIVDNMDDAWA